MQQSKPISIRLSEETLGRLKELSNEEKKSVSTIIREILETETEEAPVVERYTYRFKFLEDSDEYMLWKYGVLENSDDEMDIGPFLVEDVYDLIEQTPDILSKEEFKKAAELFHEAEKKAEKKWKKGPQEPFRRTTVAKKK